ncbi:MAG TPA: SURF1 family protein [Thermopolyspora sp.]
MFRTLFSPRLIGLHLLTIGVLVSFTLLGRWQLGVFEDSGRPHATFDPAAVPVTSLTQPGRAIMADAVARRVTAGGTFDDGRQLLVADRPVDTTGPDASASRGFWVLTPLTLPDGTILPVVRGWVATADDPAIAAVPSGDVTVIGRLRPSEATDTMPRGGTLLPAGQVSAISSAELINLWHGARLLNGYVIATEPTAGAAGPRPVATAPPTESGGFTWRNLAYAAQWWMFAAFAVFMWYHFVRDANRRGSEPTEETTAQAGYRETTEPLTR